MATFGPTAPSADTYINYFNDTTNYSGGTTFVIDATFSNTINRALMQWDVSSIPTGALVSSATIDWRIDGASSTTLTGTGTIYPVTRSVNIATCFWDVTSPWTADGAEGDYDASFGSQFTLLNGAKPANQTITVTTAVQKALTSYRFSNLITLLGRRDTEPTAGQAHLIQSKEGTTPPTLTIVYTTGYGGMLLTGAGS